MNNDIEPRDADPVFRISRDHAMSSHVDDLLKRQASLRGEQGITANRRRKWYYSNWFVFAISGAFGALVMAIVIEPFFNDMIYMRGTIQAVTPSFPGMPGIPVGQDQMIELYAENRPLGSVKINNTSIWLLSGTNVIQEDGTLSPLDIHALSIGDDVGVHIEHLAEPELDVSIAMFIERAPTQPRSTQSFRQLAAANNAASLFLFPGVAAAVGLAIGAADGLICRLLRRMLLGGAVGLVIGFIGGFISQILAGLIYMPLNELAMEQQVGSIGRLTTMGMLTQITGRSLAWCLAGMAMGLGQGVALRSSRLLLYGFLGGAIGGLLGGLVFDPIDLMLLGPNKPSAHLSRFIGMTIIGGTVGAMIGIVELLARDAWLQMIQGPLAGKEFLIFKDRVNVGASPRSDIYLFNDDDVAPQHAVIRAAADQYELEAVSPQQFPLMVNGRPVQRARLRHNDQITLGRTVFAFQKRRTE